MTSRATASCDRALRSPVWQYARRSLCWPPVSPRSPSGLPELSAQ
ncbi:MAG: hypothetical protein AAFX40_05925 [Cyanobacteria bacterium J06639_1]